MVRITRVESRREITGQLLWSLLWVGVTVVGIILSPSPELRGTHEQLGLPPCPSVLFFDRPCVGCGLTTSISATIHLDFSTAWQAHPFGPALYFLLTASAMVIGWGYFSRTRIDTGTPQFQRALMALTLLLIGFGAVRFARTTYSEGRPSPLTASRASLTGEQSR